MSPGDEVQASIGLAMSINDSSIHGSSVHAPPANLPATSTHTWVPRKALCRRARACACAGGRRVAEPRRNPIKVWPKHSVWELLFRCFPYRMRQTCTCAGGTRHTRAVWMGWAWCLDGIRYRCELVSCSTTVLSSLPRRRCAVQPRSPSQATGARAPSPTARHTAAAPTALSRPQPPQPPPPTIPQRFPPSSAVHRHPPLEGWVDVSR